MRTTSKLLQNTRIMTMKMIMMFFAGIFTAALSALGQVNSMNAGIKIAEKGISGYTFYLSHTTDESQEYSEIRGTRSLGGWVTSLEIDRDEILEPGDKLPGIPFPASGMMKDVYFYIQALDDNGNILARGWANYNYLTPGQEIEVILRLEENAKSVQFTRSGQEGDVVYVDENQIGYYDTNSGTFIIWPDLARSFGPHEYSIVDADGSPVEIGQLDMEYNPVGNDSSIIYASTDLQIEGGVEYLSPEKLSPNSEYTVDSRVALVDGQVEDAKVLVVDARQAGGYMWIVGDYIDATFYVVDQGVPYELYRITSNGDVWQGYNVSASQHRTLVVVRGVSGAKFYFSAGFNGNGGGKGKPARR